MATAPRAGPGGRHGQPPVPTDNPVGHAGWIVFVAVVSMFAPALSLVAILVRSPGR